MDHFNSPRPNSHVFSCAPKSIPSFGCEDLYTSPGLIVFCFDKGSRRLQKDMEASNVPNKTRWVVLRSSLPEYSTIGLESASEVVHPSNWFSMAFVAVALEKRGLSRGSFLRAQHLPDPWANTHQSRYPHTEIRHSWISQNLLWFPSLPTIIIIMVVIRHTTGFGRCENSRYSDK